MTQLSTSPARRGSSGVVWLIVLVIGGLIALGMYSDYRAKKEAEANRQQLFNAIGVGLGAALGSGGGGQQSQQQPQQREIPEYQKRWLKQDGFQLSCPYCSGSGREMLRDGSMSPVSRPCSGCGGTGKQRR